MEDFTKIATLQISFFLNALSNGADLTVSVRIMPVISRTEPDHWQRALGGDGGRTEVGWR